MKRKFVFVYLLSLLLMLTACGSSSKARYMGNTSQQYDEANKEHIVFWSFSVEEGSKFIKQEAYIKLKIVNDDGEVVYEENKWVDDRNYGEWTNQISGGSRLLGSVNIKDSEIAPGTTTRGSLIISAELKDGTYWEETQFSISNLPLLDFSISVPELPYKVNTLDSKKKTIRTVNLEDIEFEYSTYGSLKATVKVTMTYNDKGKSSSDYAYIGYKIKDSEGIVVQSSSMIVGPIAVGDTIKETKNLGNDFVLGEQYTIEFIDTH